MSSTQPSHAPLLRAEIDFDELIRKLDAQFAALRPPVLEGFQFAFDGVAFEMRRIKQPNNFRFLIKASLGHMPFSIEPGERRQAVRDIIAAAASLSTARFSIDHAGGVSAGAMLEMPDGAAPYSFFYPLTLFLQEALPFMHLIKRYL